MGRGARAAVREPRWAGVAPDYARRRGRGRPTPRPRPPWTPEDVSPGSTLAAPQEPPDGTLERGQRPQRGAVPVDEPLLETDVLAVSELGVGLQRRRIVGPDVEHDLVAEAQEVRGDGAGEGGRITTAAEIRVGHHVADHAHARLLRDHVRTGGAD